MVRGVGGVWQTPSVLTVVIPLYQGEAHLTALLEALSSQVAPPPFEVVIADNGSRDAGPAIAREWRDRLPVRLIDAADCRGQSAARNRGAAQAQFSCVVFLDQDDVPAPDYLARMSGALAQAPLVAARMELGKLNPGWRAQVRGVAQTTGLAAGPPFQWGYGGSLGVRLDAFRAVGGFDEQLAPAAEDEDLCWRLQAAGFRLMYATDAVLHYRIPRRWRDLLRQGYRYGLAQRVVDAKHKVPGRPGQSVAQLVLRLLIDGVRSLLSPSPLQRHRCAFLAGRRLGLLRHSGAATR